HRNEWYVRCALQVLQERAAAGRPMGEIHSALRTLFGRPGAERVLPAMWGLYVTGGTTEPWLLTALGHRDEHVRVWAIRLLVDAGAPSEPALRAFRDKATSDPSGLVLLYLASALQRLPLAERWPIAEALAGRQEFAGDAMLPLMVWYGLEPAVAG